MRNTFMIASALMNRFDEVCASFHDLHAKLEERTVLPVGLAHSRGELDRDGNGELNQVINAVPY